MTEITDKKKMGILMGDNQYFLQIQIQTDILTKILDVESLKIVPNTGMCLCLKSEKHRTVPGRIESVIGISNPLFSC